MYDTEKMGYLDVSENLRTYYLWTKKLDDKLIIIMRVAKLSTHFSKLKVMSVSFIVIQGKFHSVMEAKQFLGLRNFLRWPSAMYENAFGSSYHIWMLRAI